MSTNRCFTIKPAPQVKDTYVCLFNDHTNMNRVLRGGAWSIKGSHILIKKWSSDTPPECIAFTSLRDQIRDLPPEMITAQNILVVASKAGLVLEIESKNDIPKSLQHPKSFIRLDVNKPLCPGFLLKKRDGSMLWAYFKYGKLATFYCICGLIRHDENFRDVQI